MPTSEFVPIVNEYDDDEAPSPRVSRPRSSSSWLPVIRLSRTGAALAVCVAVVTVVTMTAVIASFAMHASQNARPSEPYRGDTSTTPTPITTTSAAPTPAASSTTSTTTPKPTAPTTTTATTSAPITTTTTKAPARTLPRVFVLTLAGLVSRLSTNERYALYLSHGGSSNGSQLISSNVGSSVHDTVWDADAACLFLSVSTNATGSASIVRRCLVNGTLSAEQPVVGEAAGAAVTYSTRMAFDWVARNVYCFRAHVSDSGTETHALQIAAADRVNKRTIVRNKDFGQPYELTIDPQAGLLFWAEWPKRHVKRSSLSGDDVRDVFGKHGSMPTNLCVQSESRRLLFLDVDEASLVSVSYDGGEASVLRRGVPRLVHMMATDGKALFWTDFITHRVMGQVVGVAPAEAMGVAVEVHKANRAIELVKDIEMVSAASPAWAASHPCRSNATCLSDQLCVSLGITPNSRPVKCVAGVTNASADDAAATASQEQAEAGSSGSGSSPRASVDSRCGSNAFRCADNTLCIPILWKCDGEADCLDQSDEADASCHTEGCGPDQFSCGLGPCIPAHWVCDGDTDCHQGQDEDNC